MSMPAPPPPPAQPATGQWPGYRTGRDWLSSRVITDIVNLLKAHKFQKDPRHAFYALGMGDMAFQDRENVSVLGGKATFGALQIVHDADESLEAVNLRTWNRLVQELGGGNALVYPFTSSGLPQVLTAEHQVLSYAEDGVSTDDVILWDSVHGVTWGPAAAGGIGPNYVFGDTYVILNCNGYTGPYTGAPSGSSVFTGTIDLGAYLAAHVFFGDVYVLCYGQTYDTDVLTIAKSVQAPWSVVFRKMTDDGDDSLTISNGRVRFDCGDTVSPTGVWNTPVMTLIDCFVDDRSFMAVKKKGTATVAAINLVRCHGYMTLSGVSLLPNSTEALNITDSSLVVDIQTSLSNAYREINITNSRVIAGATTPNDYEGDNVRNPTIVNLRGSRVAGRARDFDTGSPSWFSDAAEANFLFNRGLAPLNINAQSSSLFIPHMFLNKPSWPSNTHYSSLQITTPVVTAVASRVNVLDLAEPSEVLDSASYYLPPLTALQSKVFDLKNGSRIEVGVDMALEGGTRTTGLLLDQQTLFDEFGQLSYTPIVTSDGNGWGSFVAVLGVSDQTVLAESNAFNEFDTPPGGIAL